MNVEGKDLAEMIIDHFLYSKTPRDDEQESQIITKGILCGISGLILVMCISNAYLIMKNGRF